MVGTKKQTILYTGYLVRYQYVAHAAEAKEHGRRARKRKEHGRGDVMTLS